MFKVGDEVSYGIHGKCQVIAIETKKLGDQSLQFYQLRAIKNPIMAKTAPSKNSPQILVPVKNAEQNGLRHLMSKEQAEAALASLNPDDPYQEVHENWVTKQKRLEEVLRKEGFLGLTKVICHLNYLIERDAAPRTDAAKLFDSLFRNFLREVSEALSLNSKDTEKMALNSLQGR